MMLCLQIHSCCCPSHSSAPSARREAPLYPVLQQPRAFAGQRAFYAKVWAPWHTVLRLPGSTSPREAASPAAVFRCLATGSSLSPPVPSLPRAEAAPQGPGATGGSCGARALPTPSHRPAATLRARERAP